MSSISEHVSQWASGGDVSDCAMGGPLPPTDGAEPTLMIVQASLSCEDKVGAVEASRNYKGAVFYGLEPVAWCCLLGEEIPSFRAWGSAMFPGAQVVTVPNPVPSINCPPPNPKLTAREQIRNALKELAKTWLAQPAPAKPAA
jgi:hypothetical protein